MKNLKYSVNSVKYKHADFPTYSNSYSNNNNRVWGYTTIRIGTRLDSAIIISSHIHIQFHSINTVTCSIWIFYHLNSIDALGKNSFGNGKEFIINPVNINLKWLTRTLIWSIRSWVYCAFWIFCSAFCQCMPSKRRRARRKQPAGGHMHARV